MMLDIEAEKLSHDKIIVAKIDALARYVFFGELLTRLDTEVDYEVSTICIYPSLKVKYNPLFLANRSNKDVLFILVHEILHVVLRHHSRMLNKIPKLANIAADIVVNLMLYETLKFHPVDATIDAFYTGWTFEQVYDSLLANEDKEQSKGSFKGSFKGSSQQQKEAEHAEIIKNKHDKDPIKNDIQKSEKQDKASIEEEFQTSKELTLDAINATRSSKRVDGWGNLPATLRDFLDTFHEPKLDLSEKLAKYLSRHGTIRRSTYLRESKRMESEDLFLPGSEYIGFHVEILVDTSGSMSKDQLIGIISEIYGIITFNNSVARVIFNDAAVQNVIENVEDTSTLLDKASGGGGSDFRPAFKYLEDNKNADSHLVIAFTDGAITVPSEEPEDISVLWILSNKKCESPAIWGDVIYIND